ncbi:HNH endonuclease family protein [Celeribacter sp. ULVN23_4]
MTRSAFDDFADGLHPLPGDFPKPAQGVLSALAPVPDTPRPRCSLTTEEFFAFVSRAMVLRGSLVFWKRDGGQHLVSQRYGDNLEILLSFKTKGEVQIVRHAEVAWMLCHSRPIPAGHTVKHSDGNPRNSAKENLWLVRITD